MINTDDTVLPVLEEGGGAAKKGRLWVYCGCEPPCVIYEYSPDRQQKWAIGFLKDYHHYYISSNYLSLGNTLLPSITNN
jgi:hypothetical protein